MADRLLYRPEEVAEMLSLGRSKVYELISSGEIASIPVGRARRIPRASLERWLRDRTRPALEGHVAQPAGPTDQG